jgi:putative oxidoreductase
MRPATKDFVLAAIRIALAVTFVYAAATKVSNMELFAEETANYRLLPAQLVPFFSVCLCGVEILAGALLLVGLAVPAAAAVTGVMLIAFIVALTQALLRGINLTCGCFGGAELASWKDIFRDFLMLAACALILKYGGGRLRGSLACRRC